MSRRTLAITEDYLEALIKILTQLHGQVGEITTSSTDASLQKYYCRKTISTLLDSIKTVKQDSPEV